MKSSNIGGQAVLEGIMMKNGAAYAVAVRKPDGEIEVKKEEYKSAIKWGILTKIPFVRGVFNFVDSLVLGMKTLTYSASFWEEETDEVLTDEEAAKAKKKEDFILGVTMVLSVVLALNLFMVLPYFISTLFRGIIHSRLLRTVLEAVLRIAIFVGYILAVSKMKDIQRTFMYHGAEHKCINCIEHGMELTVENVRKQSRLHPRCGTSFMFVVVMITTLVMSVFTWSSVWMRLLIRLAMVPVIVGISYEINRAVGRMDNIISKIATAPGLFMQRFTTVEPDDNMIEVAIDAIKRVIPEGEDEDKW
ncbi:MAG: DUF1385 domain-containing protein [Clostridia bacterium]|nr:DUF1385 domain-containing protein [Clostridia bacterium]